ncbi:MAG TPA: LLM class flavin-dependent oxidoreductase [Rhodopila sp.]|uniref:LLM class flavin-dependent oxidoreductase n=1 Tax=Rhodopila sp. TaxID=2480087 RepID=UPI002C97F88D|nr:LLM class flavin-dependent oxidoreductase [Rhodopila sp.]HVY13670.1 LLM class flavin-dependent oxidoreductase [Rhodopila sp.]
MEFGVYHEFPSLAGRPDTAAFEDAFDLVEAADDWGLDIMWLAELHFDPERSVLSSPLCVASAAAARTKRIRIGIGVQVLPLGNPLRIAEDVATVDQISRGRLVLGVGRSGVARTYEAYNIPYAESRGRFGETLAIIQKAWDAPVVSFEGDYFRFADIAVTPRPFQAGGPPIYIAATSPDTYAAIGRRGKPILMGVKFEDARELAPLIQAYRDAWKAAGHPGQGHVTMRTPGYLASTAAAARADAEASLLHYYRAQAALQMDSARRPGVDGADRKRAAAERLNAMTFEEAQRGSILFGTPDEVTDRLKALERDIGLDGIMIEMNTGGLIAHEKEKAALRLLCREVMPRFR